MAQPPDAKEIETWIVRWVARQLEVSESEVDCQAPLAELGLGSREAVMLTAELEDWLGVTLSPAVAWQHPTVRLLSQHLAQRRA